MAGGAFFSGAGAPGLEVAIVDPAGIAAAGSAGGGANDGNHALEMAGLRSNPMIAGPSSEDALHAFAARLGSLASEATNQSAASGEVLAGLTRDRAEISSVSTDEEMADMIRFQRAYEANARFFTTVMIRLSCPSISTYRCEMTSSVMNVIELSTIDTFTPPG